jgi:hypothetical protein
MPAYRASIPKIIVSLLHSLFYGNPMTALDGPHIGGGDGFDKISGVKFVV